MSASPRADRPNRCDPGTDGTVRMKETHHIRNDNALITGNQTYTVVEIGTCWCEKSKLFLFERMPFESMQRAILFPDRFLTFDCGLRLDRRQLNLKEEFEYDKPRKIQENTSLS